MPRRRLSLTTVWMFASVGVVLVSMVIALALGLTTAALNTRALMRDLAHANLQHLADQILAQLEPVRDQARYVARAVADGTLDPDSRADWDRVMEGVPAGTPEITALGVLTPTAWARFVLFDPPGIFEEDWRDDPRVRENLAALRRGNGTTWFPPVWDDLDNRVLLFLATPLFRGQTFQGVFLQVLDIKAVSRRFTTSLGSPDMTPFILYGDDQVLAHPRISTDQAPLDDRGFPLPTVTDLGDPVLRQLPAAEFTPIPDTQVRVARITADGEVWHVLTRKLDKYGRVPWTVGAYYPADQVMAQMDRITTHGLIGLGLLALAVAIAAGLARITVRPIRRLAEAARRVGAGDLETPPLPPSRLRELDTAAHAFNDMVSGLRDRQRIRDLFGRYVPESVAGALLTQAGTPAPQTGEATILFADLAGFTALSERLEPLAITEVLNAYFSAATTIIEDQGGVITQFQGDGILAVFNLPIADPDHAARALAAAGALAGLVARKSFAGHSLGVRIGVNTGPVVAASVGAPARLSYTVHGDAVNLAARLEQLNKDHGTSVLIAEATVRLAPAIPTRTIGEVPIRGRQEPVKVHTLADPA